MWGDSKPAFSHFCASLERVSRPVRHEAVGRRAFEEASGIEVLTARPGDLEIVYVTPFQRMPGPKPPRSFEEAVLPQSYEGRPRHSIDVWAGRKVLSVGWDDGRPTEVIRFVIRFPEDHFRKADRSLRGASREAEIRIAKRSNGFRMRGPWEERLRLLDEAASTSASAA